MLLIIQIVMVIILMNLEKREEAKELDMMEILYE